MVSIYCQAQFAAFRPFQGGSYRTTEHFMTHSAAYGLLLNIASIDINRRGEPPPTIDVALGVPAERTPSGRLAPSMPLKQTLLHHYHVLPVSDNDKTNRVGATEKGTPERKAALQKVNQERYDNYQNRKKRSIAPVKVESLFGFAAWIQCRSTPDTEARIGAGVRGELTRFGLPFAGENDYIFDQLEEAVPAEVFWYIPLKPEDEFVKHTLRSSICIDREASEKTISRQFTQAASPSLAPPDDAWVSMTHDMVRANPTKKR